jgi:hypothetical protein
MAVTHQHVSWPFVDCVRSAAGLETGLEPTRLDRNGPREGSAQVPREGEGEIVRQRHISGLARTPHRK